jgi:PAS domain S-box-containing protein
MGKWQAMNLRILSVIRCGLIAMLLGVLWTPQRACANGTDAGLDAAPVGAAAAPFLTVEQRVWLNAHRSLRIGVTRIPPQVFRDEHTGRLSGLCIDYLRQMEVLLETSFDIVYYDTWDAMMKAAFARQIDVVYAAQQTPSRREAFLFTQPYLEFSNKIVMTDATKNTVTMTDLSGKRAAVVEGSAVQEYVRATYPEITLVAVEDELIGLLRVSFGQADAMIVEISRASWYIHQDKITNLKIVGDAGYQYRLGYACRRDWPELRDVFDAALKQIPPAQRRVMESSWIHAGQADPINWPVLLGILGGAALLIVSVVLWNFVLRQLVTNRTRELQQELTERRKAEMELVESQRRLSLLMDNLQGVVFRCLNQPDWPMEVLSKGCLELTGYPPDEFLSRQAAWNNMIVPEDQTRVWETIQDALSKHRTYQVEYRITTRDGRQKWLWEKGSGVWDQDGNAVAIEGFVSDITDRKKDQFQLQFTQFAVDHAGEAAFWMDASGKMIYVNEAACRSLGYTRQELLQMTVPDMDPNFPADHWAEHWQQTKEKGCSRIETQHRAKNGRLIPVEVSVNYVCYEGVEYHCSFARDISERKQMEEALILREREFRTLAENSPDNIARYDAHCRTIYVNPALEKTLGRPASELLGPTPREAALIDQTDEYHEKIVEVLKTGKEAEVDLVASDREGKRYHNVRFVAERGADGAITGVLAIGRDITERKAAEAVRQKLVDELQAKNEELESIVFIASHDLRSPLVNIRGFTGELEKTLALLQQLLAEEPVREATREKLDALFEGDIAEAIGFIKAGNHKMDVLLNGLLRLSRVGVAQVCPVELDVSHLLKGIINNFNFRTRQTDAAITVDGEIPPCRADAVLISQVFNNLIENAIKYRAPDRPARIHISAERKTDTVVYCVKDNGIGIAPEHVEKVFEIFHRLNPSGDESGEGLGLTIVRRLLKRQNGRVWIQSEPGTGTSVFFELPAV